MPSLRPSALWSASDAVLFPAPFGALGHQQQDWSAAYKLHSRVAWKPGRLFRPVIEKAVPLCSGRYIAAAIDDTRLHKTGRHIETAFYRRDPLSPKFRFNLMFGLPFLRISLLVPLYMKQEASTRALPVRFGNRPLSGTPPAKLRRNSGQLTGRKRRRPACPPVPSPPLPVFALPSMKPGRMPDLF